MIIILTLTEYKDKWPVPSSSDTDKQDKQLTMFIEDATNQIDNLCGGKVFSEYPKLDPSKDEIRIYKLKRAIGDLTLLLDQTGKMYYNSTTNGGGNAPFSLTTKSENSQVEWKRQDIIRNLIEAGFYSNIRTSNLGSAVVNNEEPTMSEAYSEVVKKLSGSFLRLDGTNQYNGNEMTFANTCALNNTGDINGNQVFDYNLNDWRKPILKGYDLDYDFSGVLNPLEQRLMVSINQNANDILNNRNNITNNTNDINVLKNTQRQHSADLIKLDNQVAKNTAFIESGYVVRFMGEWNPTELYRKGDYVLFNNKSYFCLAENSGQQPDISPTYWVFKDINQAIDLSNYYTKQEVDTKDSQIIGSIGVDVENEIDKYKNDFVANYAGTTYRFNSEENYQQWLVANNFKDSDFEDIIGADVDVLDQKVKLLQDKTNQQGLLINTNTTNITNNTNAINNINSSLSNYMTLNTRQTITKVKDFSDDIYLINNHSIGLGAWAGANTLHLWPEGNNGRIGSSTGKLVLSGSTIDMNNKRVENVANPTNANDVATKAYVDNLQNQITLLQNKINSMRPNITTLNYTWNQFSDSFVEKFDHDIVFMKTYYKNTGYSSVHTPMSVDLDSRFSGAGNKYQVSYYFHFDGSAWNVVLNVLHKGDFNKQPWTVKVNFIQNNGLK